jgi:hypothetical protein
MSPTFPWGRIRHRRETTPYSGDVCRPLSRESPQRLPDLRDRRNHHISPQLKRLAMTLSEPTFGNRPPTPRSVCRQTRNFPCQSWADKRAGRVVRNQEER